MPGQPYSFITIQPYGQKNMKVTNKNYGELVRKRKATADHAPNKGDSPGRLNLVSGSSKADQKAFVDASLHDDSFRFEGFEVSLN